MISYSGIGKEKYNEEIEELGYFCDEDVVHTKRKYDFYDKNGYKYRVKAITIKRGTKPNMCDPSNPYTLENINKFMKEHRVGFELVSGQKYATTSTKLKLICSIHGEIENTWNKISQLKLGICKQCGIEATSDAHRDSMEQIIIDFKAIHGGKYDYSLVENIKRELHQNNGKMKVEIICPKHGIFKMSILAHKQGANCPKCVIIDSRKDNKKALEDLQNMHGYKYQYPNFNYSLSQGDVIITCKKHGDFKMQYARHLRGSGCPKCANEITGWKKSDWVAKGLSSKNNTGFKVYILKCFDDSEVFFKIGITYTDITKRFYVLPYNYEILLEKNFNENGNLAYDIEKILHRDNKKFKYSPLVKFSGVTECFSEILPMEEILQIINKNENRDN